MNYPTDYILVWDDVAKTWLTVVGRVLCAPGGTWVND